MIPRQLSFWDQLQLVFLRLLATFLGAVDGLFHVRWGERLLERMAHHWQTQLVHLQESIDALEKERNRLHAQAEALAIHAAAIYLGGRTLARNQLVFDPAEPHDEELLDATIEILVKEQLATLETQEIEPGRYLYHLEPDWRAIRGRLAETAAGAEPDIADWLQEGLKFIDEAFLSR